MFTKKKKNYIQDSLPAISFMRAKFVTIFYFLKRNLKPKYTHSNSHSLTYNLASPPQIPTVPRATLITKTWMVGF